MRDLGVYILILALLGLQFQATFLIKEVKDTQSQVIKVLEAEADTVSRLIDVHSRHAEVTKWNYDGLNQK